MSLNPDVAVAMSGGVDSSVAAALLKEHGHRVLGVTFHLIDCAMAARTPDARACCSRLDVADAVRVADALGLPHELADFTGPFRRHVLEPFVAAWGAGETPNPCIECNRHVKFDAFLRYARERGCSRIATGHYAIIDRAGDRWALRKGRDSAKEQSYFVHPIGQDTLPYVLFPLGGWTKAKVRRKAADLGLPVAHKRESQEICFAAGGSHARFLETHGGVEAHPGEIVLEDGTVVGRHKGLHRYTVGQRRGLDVPWKHPLYVLERRPGTNRLVVGPEEALDSPGLDAVSPTWTCGEPPRPGEQLSVRIRYRSREAPATVLHAGHDGFSVRFLEPVRGIAPGQAAVLYRGDEVAGGGRIRRAHPRTGERDA